MRRTCDLAESVTDVIASWCMKTTTNPLRKAVMPSPDHRQTMLEFEGSGRWRELPETDRDACVQALARFLYQTITRQPEENENER